MNRLTPAHIAAILSLAVLTPAANAEKKEMDLRLDAKAGLSYNTLHFIVERYDNKAEALAQTLEATYTDFQDVTGATVIVLPERIHIVIFANQKEFRAKTGVRNDKILSLPNKIVTYEQDRLARMLVNELCGKLYESQIGDFDGRNVRWLRRGLSELVILRRSGADVVEERQKWRTFLRKESPASLEILLGQERPKRAEKEKIREREKERVNERDKERKRFQMTATSLVNFLREWGGALNFSFFMKSLKGGATLDDAVAQAYPGKVRNFGELYDFWRAQELGS